MLLLEHIAAILKAARLKKNLTQRELSSRTKIPQAHLSKIERAEVDLQTTSLIAISRTLELELMLIPKELVPLVRSLLKEPKTENQVPKYQLTEEDANG